MSDAEAWLFHCWKPGKHCVFASVMKDDNSWWGEGWSGVTRTELVTRGAPELLNGTAPPIGSPTTSADDERNTPQGRSQL